MRKAWVLGLLAVFCASSYAATPVWDKAMTSKWGNIALGPSMGQMMGVSAKYWELKQYALDAGAGYTWDKYFILHADYLFQFPRFPVKEVVPYAGGGVEYSYATNESKADKSLIEVLTSRKVWGGLGLRFPLGFEWIPSNSKVGFFAEFVPGIGIFPEIFQILRGGGGFRVYF